MPAASAWGVKNNLYPKDAISKEERCAEEMRRAVRRATHIDPQGRRNIKTYGALPLFDGDGNKSYMLIDMRRATLEDAKAVLDDDFAGVNNDVRSHDNQRSSYNDNNLFNAFIEPYDYNLNHVVGQTVAEYDDSYNDDDFNEEE